MGTLIRDFNLKDYEALTGLWDESGLPYKRKGRDAMERIAEEIKHGNAVFLVAECEGKIVGSVFGTHEGRKGWINRLAVAPSFRRRGIGARLVGEVERRFARHGIEIVACLIEEWNRTSMEVFRRLGFRHHPDILYFTKRKREDV